MSSTRVAGIEHDPRLGRNICAIAALLAAACLSIGAAAQPQAYPSQPIRIIIGTSLDVYSRIIAEHLQQAWGQSVIVEPRPGGGGSIAANVVSTAKPDGHTLLFATPTFTLNTVLGRATYDVSRDFEPVSIIGSTAYVLVVHTKLLAATVAELANVATKRSGGLTCASPGIGTAPHLACEAMSKVLGGQVLHVPYRDVASAMGGTVGGHVQMSFAVAAVAKTHIQSGALRGLAVTTEQRSSFLPELPTLVELGHPNFIMRGWGGFLVPAGTPSEIVQKLNSEIRMALARPDVVGRLHALGSEVAPDYLPSEVRNFIGKDISRWTQLVRAIGLEKLRETTPGTSDQRRGK